MISDLLNRRLLSVIYPICPVCDGTGGSEGYYGGDWTGCSCCNPDEDREEPVTRIWFWQVWQHHYEMWKTDRWVDQQIKLDELERDDSISNRLLSGYGPAVLGIVVVAVGVWWSV